MDLSKFALIPPAAQEAAAASPGTWFKVYLEFGVVGGKIKIRKQFLTLADPDEKFAKPKREKVTTSVSGEVEL